MRGLLARQQQQSAGSKHCSRQHVNRHSLLRQRQHHLVARDTGAPHQHNAGTPRQHIISTVATASASPQAGGASFYSASSTATSSSTQHASDNAVFRLYDAINMRDVAQLAACLAPDVQYGNLAFSDTFAGATAVSRFYADSLRALPEGAEIQLEQQTQAAGLSSSTSNGSGSAATTMAVVWRLVLPGSQTTVSRGIAFFTLDPSSGRISSILDAPEHPVKLSARGLNVFGPLGRDLAGSMLPAVQELGRAMQQGVDLLLQPLEGMMTTQQEAGGSSSSSTFPEGGSSSGGSAAAGGGGVNSRSSWVQPSTSTTTPVRAMVGAGPISPAAAATTPPSSSSSTLAGSSCLGSSRRSVTTAAAAAAALGAAGGQGLQPQQPDGGNNIGGTPNFSGLWAKVPERSDLVGYEATLDVLGLSGLQKVTARLIEGVEIQQTDRKFTVSFVTVVPFFKVTEDVPLDGGSTQLGRRDLRFGRQTTAARSIAGGVLVEMSWGPPLAGTLTEKYTLLEDGCLCVEADTRVGDKAANSKTVYRRSSGSRDQLLSDSKRRNPSVAAVLQQQRDSGLDV